LLELFGETVARFFLVQLRKVLVTEIGTWNKSVFPFCADFPLGQPGKSVTGVTTGEISFFLQRENNLRRILSLNDSSFNGVVKMSCYIVRL